MSQVDPQLIALVVQKMHEMLFANACGVAATTLLYYDYTITFADEVRCIWKRKFTGASLLFFINRYVTLIYRTLMIVQMLPWQTQTEKTADMMSVAFSSLLRLLHALINAHCSCNSVLHSNQVLTVLLELTVALFMSLRMYAIWRKDRWMFAVIFSLGIIAPAINIYYYTTFKIVAAPLPFTGCAEYVNLNTPSATFVFNRVFAIAYDALILILTWVKTAGIMRSFSQLGVKASLTTLLLRDGTVYFLFLLILNVCNLIAIKLQAWGALPAITEVVTSILISRFILNLRGVYTSGDNSAMTGSLHLSKFTDVRFASSIVGNLGAPLGFAAEERRSFLNESDLQGGYVANVSDDPLMEFLPPASDDAASSTPRDSRSPEDEEKVYVYDDDDDDVMSVIDIKPGV